MSRLVKGVFIATVFVTSVCAFSPPKGLLWGMKHDEASNVLQGLPQGEKVNLKEGKKSGEYAEGFKVADLESVRLLDKETHKAYLVFDSTGGLCALEYVFKWGNTEKAKTPIETANKGRSESWKFYENLLEALKNKYGDPKQSISKGKMGQTVRVGHPLLTGWLDDGGDKIELKIWREDKNLVVKKLDAYYVGLSYYSAAHAVARKDQLVKDADI